MSVLVINCGSSSVKFALFSQDDPVPLASGMVDRIGTDEVAGSYRLRSGVRHEIPCAPQADHAAGLDAALTALRSEPSFG